MSQTIIITSLISIIAGFLIAKFIYGHKSYEKGKIDGAFEKEKDIFYNEVDNKQTFESELLNSKLELNFNKGKEEGRKEEREKLNIHITPKIQIKDGFFKKTLYTGYNLQVTYDGFPIGNQYVSVKEIEKFKQENFKYLTDTLQRTINGVVETYLNKGISASAEKIPTKPISK